MIWQQIIDLFILRFTYRLVHGVLQKHHDFLALGHLDRYANLSQNHTQPPSVEYANLPSDLWSSEVFLPPLTINVTLSKLSGLSSRFLYLKKKDILLLQYKQYMYS